MKVVERKIRELKPAHYNPRRMTGDQRRALRESLEKFGLVDPVIVNRHPDRIDIVVGGHQRLEIWEELGNSTVPTVEVKLEIGRERELNIRLNKNTGEWNFELLEELFTGAELLEWGFVEDDLSDLIEDLDKEGKTDPDVVPDVKESVVREGEIWRLGDHRVLCGSSLNLELVNSLFAGDRAKCMWTDPPYNVDYKGGTGMKIKNDSMTQSEFAAFLEQAFVVAGKVLEKGAPFYMAHASKEVRAFWDALEKGQFEVKQILAWVKDRFILGRQDFHWQHEPIFYGWRKGAAHAWYGGRKLSTVFSDGNVEDLSREELIDIVKLVQRDVIECPAPQKNDIHPTMKPVDLIKPMLRNSTKARELVYDPFLGSGSTLMAAEIVGRRCFGCELDPAYATALIERWQNFTGREAIIDSTGESYYAAKHVRV